MRQPAFVALVALFAGALITPCGAQNSARVSGTVRDTAGHPLAGVQVSVRGTAMGTLTDAAGTFQLDRVPTSAKTVLFRRLGFRSAEAKVQLDSGKNTIIEQTLVAVPIELQKVEVGAPAPPMNLGLQGFEARRKLDRGQFATTEDWQSYSPKDVESVLRHMHSLRVTITKDGPLVLSTRGLIMRNMQPAMCAMQIGLNGKVMDQFQIDDIGIDQVKAIEVYAGPSTIPSEFNTTRSSGSSGFGRSFSSTTNSYCGLVMIWTEH